MKCCQVVCSSPVSLLSKKQTKTDIEDPIASVSSADLASHATLLLLTVTSRERVGQYREIFKVVASNSEHQSVASFSAEQGKGEEEERKRRGRGEAS
jgi:hypothetical protein